MVVKRCRVLKPRSNNQEVIRYLHIIIEDHPVKLHTRGCTLKELDASGEGHCIVALEVLLIPAVSKEMRRRADELEVGAFVHYCDLETSSVQFPQEEETCEGCAQDDQTRLLLLALRL